MQQWRVLMLTINNTIVHFKNIFSTIRIRKQNRIVWKNVLPVGIVQTLMHCWILTDNSVNTVWKQWQVGIRKSMTTPITSSSVRISRLMIWPISRLEMLLLRRTMAIHVSWRWFLGSDVSTMIMPVNICWKVISVLMLLPVLLMVTVGDISLLSLLHGVLVKKVSWKIRKIGWTTWRFADHGGYWVIKMHWQIIILGWIPII